MAVDWQDIEDAYAELLASRDESNRAVLMRLSEMQLALNDALDAHVEHVVKEYRWSWQAVGDALGVTRQAASKRWTHKVFPR